MPPEPRISDREAEVLDLVAEHLTNAEIAERLFISIRTVESHVSTLLRKLDVEDRRALARAARERAEAAAPRTNLPFALTSFVGRDGERQAIHAALGDARLVTISGPGGVGKTRLALEVGRRLIADGLPRLWFVDLARVVDGSGVLPEVLAAAGGAVEPGRRPVDALAAELDRSGAVLVLDNCEHVIDPVAEVAGALLSRTQRLRLLLTSREALGVAGEQVVPIAPFVVPSAATSDLDALTTNEAVRLFVDRARAVDPKFALDPETTTAVASIVRHLDGLPLAVELAAAQVVALSPAQIDARLRNRFSLLGGRTSDPRHGTLETMLDWSYQLLRERERSVFDRLAVFRGAFTLDAIEAVVVDDEIDRSDVGPILTALVRKSLVGVDDRGTERRYRLLETVREFAWRNLELAAQLDVWRDRHLAWVFDLASEAGDALHGPDQPIWLDRLDDDLDDLEAAFAWSIEDPIRADRAIPVVAGLYPYWLARGTRRSQGTRWSQAVAIAATETELSRRTRSLLSSVSLTMWSDLEASDVLAAATRRLAGDDPLASLHADVAEAWVAGFRGEPRPSLAERAVAVGMDHRMVLWIRGFDAIHHSMIESGPVSTARITEVAAGFQDAGDDHLFGSCLSFAADFGSSDEPDLARQHAGRSLEIAKRFGCMSCESGALTSLVLVDDCADLGGPVAAARRSVALANGIGEVVNVFAAIDVLVGALARADDLDGAAVLGFGVMAARARSGFAPFMPGRERARLAGLETAEAHLGPAAMARLEIEAARLSYTGLVTRAVTGA